MVDSPVSLVITDPRGRRLGADPVAGEAFAEIPYGEVVNDGINDPDSGAMHTETRTYAIGGPADAFGNVGDAGGGVLDGDYDITVIGTGSGPYTLTVISEDVTGQAKRRFVTGTATTALREHVFVRRASAAGSAVEVSTSNVPVSLPGDVLMNGAVNIDDVNAILRRANASAEGDDDPMDLDHDGRITALDARKAAVLCTKPRCAR